uniref:LRRCT domain-containing protein n=1 Tax=Cyanoderma ruficeps TaxID=181631 RepID=A0A8C3RDH9_9PASS
MNILELIIFIYFFLSLLVKSEMSKKAKNRDMCVLQSSPPCPGAFLYIFNCFLLLLLQKETFGCPSACQLCTGRQVNCRNAGDLLSLRYLTLQRNRLSVLGSGAFWGMISLQTLNLANNKISRISDSAFHHLENLAYLFLEDRNKITSIDNGTFEKMGQSLKVLNLAFNNITELQPELLKPLVSLTHLQVHSNPWNCSCKMLALLNWLASFSVSAKIHCQDPQSMRGRPLHYMRWAWFSNCIGPSASPVNQELDSVKILPPIKTSCLIELWKMAQFGFCITMCLLNVLKFIISLCHFNLTWIGLLTSVSICSNHSPQLKYKCSIKYASIYFAVLHDVSSYRNSIAIVKQAKHQFLVESRSQEILGNQKTVLHVFIVIEFLLFLY